MLRTVGIPGCTFCTFCSECSKPTVIALWILCFQWQTFPRRRHHLRASPLDGQNSKVRSRNRHRRRATMQNTYRIIVPFLTFRAGSNPHFSSFSQNLAPTKRSFSHLSVRNVNIRRPCAHLLPNSETGEYPISDLPLPSCWCLFCLGGCPSSLLVLSLFWSKRD